MNFKDTHKGCLKNSTVHIAKWANPPPTHTPSKHEISILLSYRKGWFIVKRFPIGRPGSPVPKTTWELSPCTKVQEQCVRWDWLFFLAARASTSEPERFKNQILMLTLSINVTLGKFLTALSLSSLICKIGLIRNVQGCWDWHLTSGNVYTIYHHVSYMTVIHGNLGEWK